MPGSFASSGAGRNDNRDEHLCHRFPSTNDYSDSSSFNGNADGDLTRQERSNHTSSSEQGDDAHGSDGAGDGGGSGRDNVNQLADDVQPASIYTDMLPVQYQHNAIPRVGFHWRGKWHIVTNGRFTGITANCPEEAPPAFLVINATAANSLELDTTTPAASSVLTADPSSAAGPSLDASPGSSSSPAASPAPATGSPPTRTTRAAAGLTSTRTTHTARTAPSATPARTTPGATPAHTAPGAKSACAPSAPTGPAPASMPAAPAAIPMSSVDPPVTGENHEAGLNGFSATVYWPAVPHGFIQMLRDTPPTAAFVSSRPPPSFSLRPTTSLPWPTSPPLFAPPSSPHSPSSRPVPSSWPPPPFTRPASSAQYAPYGFDMFGCPRRHPLPTAEHSASRSWTPSVSDSGTFDPSSLLLNPVPSQDISTLPPSTMLALSPPSMSPLQVSVGEPQVDV
ncbi:uncharacterized protein PHACADRAFT_184911 [Phanerochaete carnosa HHB-10118-sp]|uniref:Uncharacterized protein n=1 Tax=Phanerochaete carnosa (strain HHB-10118-sp) TaxID=650164 RepID=K5W428_PHACS|nr:uncharacterized protein PHACADRAFT_184911 [Phanerochaete carnosa HHB-10118-sp]EKM53870.1 hypothetical protein PHACADRAFT_184911 [Phanerochaete carnosa HHB-10118-sp]